MSDNTQTLTFTQQIDAPVKAVYRSCIDPNLLQVWFANSVDVDASEKGRLFAWWEQGYYSGGSFLKVEENKELAFNWQGLGEPGATKVILRFEEKDGGTLVTLEHKKLGTGSEWEGTLKNVERGWPVALENLQWLHEKGVDKRIYDRPFMGIYIRQEVSEEQAKKMDLPVKGGILIDGALDDTGAAEVGLQQEDLIVQLGEHEILNFQTLGKAIGTFKAEQVIETVFYREGEKQTAQMKLSRRPFPDVPDTFDEVVEQAQKIYAELDAALEGILEGVTEEEASFNPEEGEWSAKEALSHLIYDLNVYLVYLNSLAGMQKGPNYFEMPGFQKNYAQVFPSVAEMAAEFKRLEQLVLNLAASLPEDVMSIKFYYVQVANRFVQFTQGHTTQHFDQIKDAIAAAREK